MRKLSVLTTAVARTFLLRFVREGCLQLVCNDVAIFCMSMSSACRTDVTERARASGHETAELVALWTQYGLVVLNRVALCAHVNLHALLAGRSQVRSVGQEPSGTCHVPLQLGYTMYL